MAEYRLYCFAQSGNAYKVALMLNLCGADWEPRFVNFMRRETFTPEYHAINEMGEVPVLEHEGQRLSQSGVILDYLVGRFGQYGWKDDEERREILRWLMFDNHKVSGYAPILRFFLQYLRLGDTPVTQFLRSRLNAALKVLDRRLATRRFVAFERPTIADFSLCGYLYWNDEFGEDWSQYPNIPPWLGHIKALPGWVHPYALMPGHPVPTEDLDAVPERFLGRSAAREAKKEIRS
jgi:glutathione S-transferase